MIGLARWLPIVVALAVFAVDLPVVHDHETGNPGIFDEDCPLERLAAGTGSGVASPRPDLQRPTAAIDAPAPARTPALPARPALPVDARAPPTTG
jgi:hypothetical protein